MTYRVRLTAKAEADIDASLAWFRDQKAMAEGERWFLRLSAKIGSLATRPERCSVALESEDIGLEIRELLFGKRQAVYRILFRIEKRVVVVLRVWHGSRDRIARSDLDLP